MNITLFVIEAVAFILIFTAVRIAMVRANPEKWAALFPPDIIDAYCRAQHFTSLPRHRRVGMLKMASLFAFMAVVMAIMVMMADVVSGRKAAILCYGLWFVMT